MVNTVTIRYTTYVDPSIDYKQSELNKLCNKILNSTKGVKSLYNQKIKFIRDDSNYVYKYKLVPEQRIVDHCHMEGLSCADLSINTIFINSDMWCNGSQVFKEGLRGSKRNWLYKYRCYLLTHETLHLLGFLHPKESERFDGRAASVMCQQTVDLRGGWSNEFPQVGDKKYFDKNNLMRRWS
jgi:hypothetical protein